MANAIAIDMTKIHTKYAVRFKSFIAVIVELFPIREVNAGKSIRSCHVKYRDSFSVSVRFLFIEN